MRRDFFVSYDGYLIIFFISLLVMLPLFSKGYIFTLDHVTHENAKSIFFDYLLGFSEDNDGIFLTTLPIPNLLYMFSLFIFGSIFSVEVFQKIFFLFLLFFSGAAAYYACPTKKTGKLFAGILYMINPFTYVRFLAGHTYLLLSYAFLPLFFKSLMDFSKRIKECIKIKQKEKIFSNTFSNVPIKSAAKLSILATICIATTHYLPIILGSLLVFFVLDFFMETKKEIKKVLTLSYLFTFILFFALNFYWIVPISGETSPHYKIEQFSELDLELFSSKPSLEFNTIFNTISLHGFWRGGYDYAKYHISLWPLIFFVILFLSVHGFLVFKNKRKYAFLLVTVISSIIAIGIGYQPLENIIKLLYSRFEFLMGLREPHKLLAILCLFYSYFGGIGISDLLNPLEKIKIGIKRSRDIKAILFLKYLLIFVIITLPIIYSYTMLFGFNNYLKPTNYPKDWYEVNDFLKNDEEDFNVIFFPWHLYMDFKWIENYDKRIANPARTFFEKPIISAENIEAGGIYSQTSNAILRYIELLLSKSSEIDNFGELISLVNVKYILLTKEVDWKNYLWLKDQKDLEIVKETENFIIFKNNKYRGKIYIAKDILKAENWEDILRISKYEDISKLVFSKEDKNKEYKNYECNDVSIEYKKISPIEYEINLILKNTENKSDSKSKRVCLVVFSSRYSSNWMSNKSNSINILDIANAFEVEIEENNRENLKIFYKNFLHNFYLLSVFAFFILVFIAAI
ncbi:MAG: hypothetical protein QXJ96_01935 [Candidatus Aenigmatarchaeota archaeon]|nr:hypothetical protein [Candidatus Aenigmarchaeota archaeon]